MMEATMDLMEYATTLTWEEFKKEFPGVPFAYYGFAFDIVAARTI